MISIPPIPRDIANEVSSILNNALNANISIYDKIEICYEQVDKILNILKESFPCKPGCSFCCKHDVLITELEANYISLKTGIKLNMQKFSYFNHSNCPFLKDDFCSIYKYRPFICRTYHILASPENCKKDLSNKCLQYGKELSGYGNPIFKAIGEWINIVNSKANYSKKDIRDFFELTYKSDS